MMNAPGVDDTAASTSRGTTHPNYGSSSQRTTPKTLKRRADELPERWLWTIQDGHLLEGPGKNQMPRKSPNKFYSSKMITAKPTLEYTPMSMAYRYTSDYAWIQSQERQCKREPDE